VKEAVCRLPARADALEADVDGRGKHDGDGGHSHALRQENLRYTRVGTKSSEQRANMCRAFCRLGVSDPHPRAALIGVEVAAVDNDAAALLHGGFGSCKALGARAEHLHQRYYTKTESMDEHVCKGANILRNAVIIGLEQVGERAFAAARGAHEHNDALLRRRKANARCCVRLRLHNNSATSNSI
jgi:hypothetical protein